MSNNRFLASKHPISDQESHPTDANGRPTTVGFWLENRAGASWIVKGEDPAGSRGMTTGGLSLVSLSSPDCTRPGRDVRHLTSACLWRCRARNGRLGESHTYFDAWNLGCNRGRPPLSKTTGSRARDYAGSRLTTVPSRPVGTHRAARACRSIPLGLVRRQASYASLQAIRPCHPL